MLLENMMTKNVLTATVDTTVATALEVIREKNIRHLPVVDQAGALVGMVNDRDLRAVVNAARDVAQDWQTKKVGEIMHPSEQNAHPLDHIDDAARLLYEYKLSALPVIQNGELVGIVTATDVLRAFVELLGVTRPGTLLEVELPDEPGMLAEITRIVSDFGININSIYMLAGSRPEQRQIALRLEAFDLGPIISALNKAGCKVVWPIVKEY